MILIYTKFSRDADVAPVNNDTLGIKFLDGLGLESTYGEPTPPDPNAPHLQGGTSYSYYYVGNVSSVNGQAYTDLIGMRNPEYKSDWPQDQRMPRRACPQPWTARPSPWARTTC